LSLLDSLKNLMFYLNLFLIFLLSLFQGAFLPINLVLAAVLFRTAVEPDPKSLLLAFFGGFFLDLILGQPWGLSAIIFLSASFLLFFYKQKFAASHPFFLTVFVFLMSLINDKLVKGYLSWRGSFLLAVLTFLFSFFWWQLFIRPSGKRINLKT